MSNTSGNDVWKVIKGLNGTPDAKCPSEAMPHNVRRITDAKGKANAFVNHYARVNNLSMTAEDCYLIREFKNRIDSSSTDNESCSKFTMGKLTSAIQKMKQKEAAGPDDTPPTFLKALDPITLQELLEIFNALFV